MNWFGEPWPSADKRAPVCEDNADRIDIPIGVSCAHCSRLFVASSQGVVIPHLDCCTGPSYYHVMCFLATVVGHQMALELGKDWYVYE